MYVLLSENETKLYYQQILKETTKIIEELVKSNPKIPIYNSIYNQLIDIQKNVVDECKFSKEEIAERYSIGSIAVRNFEREEPLYHRLCDIYGGAVDYMDLK